MEISPADRMLIDMIEPSPDELASLLSSMPVLSSVSEDLLDEIIDRLNWIELDREEVLFEEGDTPDSLYIVVFGRLRARVNRSGREEMIGEITRGEYVGEMGFIADEPRSATIEATRESYLVSLDRSVFETLIGQHPEQLTTISKLLIDRLRSSISAEPAQSDATFCAFVPLSSSVDLDGLLSRIEETFPDSRHNERLDRSWWLRQFCRGESPETFREAEFLEWLYRREETGERVFFECTTEWGRWNEAVLKNADRILLVGDGSGSPSLKPVESHDPLVPESGSGTRTELILTWPGSDPVPHDTKEWLEPRNLNRHYHVRAAEPEDVERLSRFLRDRAVGLALGGGGARGLAHAGVLQALDEEAMAVDYVGGTSIGAVLGALWISSHDTEGFLDTLRDHFLAHGSMLDYTLPVVSLCRGHNFIELLDDLFGDRRIEDLPVPFFCVSTDLTHAETRVHERGSLQRWILASIAIPVIGPPVLDRGDLLVDGGVLNNLPVDEIRSRVGGPAIAVDVSPSEELTGPDDRIEPPSPYELAGRKLTGLDSGDMPTILDLIWRTATISSEHQNSGDEPEADLLVQPSVEDCGLFEWDRLEELVHTGYRRTRSILDERTDSGTGIE